MEYKISPPAEWIRTSSDSSKIDIYEFITSKYKDNDILFKVIKNNGKIKELTKEKCQNYSLNLAKQIQDDCSSKNSKKQLKIFGVIGASEESIILMLSSLLLGAHHCICFEDLSEEAIIQRINIFKPDIILSRKTLSKKIQKVLDLSKKKNLKALTINLDSKKIIVKDFEKKFYYSKHNLFSLFTSGSTGLPKAITHGVWDYLKYAEYTTNYFFGIRKGSIIFTSVDAGWINGHTYAFYGPLLLGAISIINENPISISVPKLLGKYLGKIKPDCFYTSVTMFRLIKSLVDQDKSIIDYANQEIGLDRIGSCGEPLANNVGDWARTFFKPKRESIVNTYFQTETGGVLVAPRDEDNPPKNYACVGKPRLELGMAIAKDILDKTEIERDRIDPNEILVCNHWDGIFKEIISDKKSKYFTQSGFFRLHDVGFFDEDGYLFIGGRSDDVINVSGHRISTSEIESISISLEGVIEACAVATEDKICGSRVILYFSSKVTEEDYLENLKKEINNIIKTKLTKYHIPKDIFHFQNLPKTKSGKIMRRIMRELQDNDLSDKKRDYSTLANKEEFLICRKNYLKYQKN